jgi:hypothetical protein
MTQNTTSRKRNSSKINLTISLVFHSVLIAAVFFLAAREGLLGKDLKRLTATLVPKEKKPEPEKPKPEEPKVVQTRTEVPKVAQIPQPQQTQQASAPAPASVAPAAAPPSVDVPSFFSDGAKEVAETRDENAVYKGYVEATLRSRWMRPDDIPDETYVARVNVEIDASGRLVNYDWIKGSDDKRWDDSVRQVLNSTKAFSSRPPKKFPMKFEVRFDVEAAKTESMMELSVR